MISGLWDEIPQFYSVDTKTPYATTDSPLVLDDATQRSIQSGQATLSAWIPVATQFDLTERRDYSSDNANPSRVHTLASRAADHLAAARQTVARFVNAADASEIVFVRGTTEGVNLVASAWGPTNLKSGDEIVISIANIRRT